MVVISRCTVSCMYCTVLYCTVLYCTVLVTLVVIASNYWQELVTFPGFYSYLASSGVASYSNWVRAAAKYQLGVWVAL